MAEISTIVVQEGRCEPYTYKVIRDNGEGLGPFVHTTLASRIVDRHYLLEQKETVTTHVFGVVCNENATGADLRLHHHAMEWAKERFGGKVTDKTHYARGSGTGTGH